MKVITYIHKGRVKNVSVDDLKKLKVELTDAWEHVCTQCGKCCFEKSMKNGVWLINYSKHCQFLKFEHGKAVCKVYKDRFSKEGQCNTVPEAIQKRYLPPKCPYVKSVPQYKAPVDDGSWYMRARIKLSKEGGMILSPTDGTATAKYPYKETGLPTREDLAKPKEWKLRRDIFNKHKKEHNLLATGKAGTSDPRQKNSELDKKPSGHALGG